MIITALKAEHVQLELYDPFILSIRSATHANIVRWRLEVEREGGEKAEYPGESVPVQYVTGENVESVLSAAADLESAVLGKKIADLDKTVQQLASSFPNDIAARAGIEIALYNAYAALNSTSVHRLLGGKAHELITDITIAKVPNAVEIAERAWLQGFRTFKLKVGGENFDLDINRIIDIASRFPEARFRLDANQGFTASGALEFLRDLGSRKIHIELIEQPVAKEDMAALDEVARQTSVPVIADEGCKTAEDAEHLFKNTAIQGVNIKLMKSGIQGALRIIEVAKRYDKRLMMGCMLESEVGMAASIALAAGTGAFDHIDLDGHLLVKLTTPLTAFSAEGPYLRVVD